MHSDFKAPPGTGYLFKGEGKPSPKCPDYKTTITLPSGQIFSLALWEAVSQRTGKPYLKARLEEVSSDYRRALAHSQPTRSTTSPVPPTSGRPSPLHDERSGWGKRSGDEHGDDISRS